MTNEEKMWILAVAEAVIKRDDLSIKNLREEVLSQMRQELKRDSNPDPYRT